MRDKIFLTSLFFVALSKRENILLWRKFFLSPKHFRLLVTEEGMGINYTENPRDSFVSYNREKENEIINNIFPLIIIVIYLYYCY